jgi:hypothetical protein
MKPIATRRTLAALVAAGALSVAAVGGVAGTSSASPSHPQAPKVMAFETQSPYCGYAYSPSTCDDAGATGAWTVNASARRYQH